MSSETNKGRYTVIDFATKRRFVVECIHNRNDKDDGDWKNGGIDKVKHRGSMLAEESIITEENGFKNIVTGGKGVSPMDMIDQLLGTVTAFPKSTGE